MHRTSGIRFMMMNAVVCTYVVHFYTRHIFLGLHVVLFRFYSAIFHYVLYVVFN